MLFFLASFLCLVAILAITIISADASGLKGAPKPKKSISLTTGAWVNTFNDKSTTYVKFNEDFTYDQVEVSNTVGNGDVDCSNHLTGIYNHMNEEKNPSILDLSFIYLMNLRPFGKGRALPTRFLFYETGKKGKEFSLEVIADPSYNLTFNAVKSMPKCPPVLRATVDWVAEGPIKTERPMLTWMGPDIGLYVSSVMQKVNHHNHDGVVDDDIESDSFWGFRDGLFPVVSETDGYTVNWLAGIYPTSMTQHNGGCDYPFVVASFGDIFWTSSWCGKANKLFQSNTNFASISLPGQVRGAVAMSASILFVQYGNSIAKIDVTNNQILVKKEGVPRGDLAISSDRSTVYYLTESRGDDVQLFALNSTDLSVMHTYAVDVPADYYIEIWDGTMIEITPTHLWISLHKGRRENYDDDGSYYYNNDNDDDEVSRNTMYLAHLTIPQQ